VSKRLTDGAAAITDGIAKTILVGSRAVRVNEERGRVRALAGYTCLPPDTLCLVATNGHIAQISTRVAVAAASVSQVEGAANVGTRGRVDLAVVVGGAFTVLDIR
jgi:hypothetical protein